MRGANFDNHYGLVRGAINLLFLLAAAWLEPGSCISLPHHHSHSHRAPRELGTDPDTALTLQFILLTDTTADCTHVDHWHPGLQPRPPLCGLHLHHLHRSTGACHLPIICGVFEAGETFAEALTLAFQTQSLSLYCMQCHRTAIASFNLIDYSISI